MELDKIIRWISEHLGVVIFLAWLLEPILKRIFRKRGQKEAEPESEATARPAPAPERSSESTRQPDVLPEVSSPEPKELLNIAAFRAKVLTQHERALELEEQALDYLSDEEISNSRIAEDIELLERIVTFTEYLRHEADLKNLRGIFAQITARLNQLEQQIAQRKRAQEKPVAIPLPVLVAPKPAQAVLRPVTSQSSTFSAALTADMRSPQALEEAMALSAVFRRKIFRPYPAGF